MQRTHLPEEPRQRTDHPQVVEHRRPQIQRDPTHLFDGAPHLDTKRIKRRGKIDHRPFAQLLDGLPNPKTERVHLLADAVVKFGGHALALHLLAGHQGRCREFQLGLEARDLPVTLLDKSPRLRQNERLPGSRAADSAFTVGRAGTPFWLPPPGGLAFLLFCQLAPTQTLMDQLLR
jgi:hypothetical protein